MPTRQLDNPLLQRAFDVLAPPSEYSKQYLRWKRLSQLTGLGEHWVRKRYQDRDRSELDLRSITQIRHALEAKRLDSSGEEVQSLVDLLIHIEQQGGPKWSVSRAAPTPASRMRLRVINVGFVRSSNANYCQRLEAGIRIGLLDVLQLTHLVNDESVDLERVRSSAARTGQIGGLLERFCTDPGYVDRTYLVPLGTVAAKAVCQAVCNEPSLRQRLGRSLRIIFAGVTDPASTGILDLDHEHVGGVSAGPTFEERLQFIEQAFPRKSVAFLYDSTLPQDVIAKDRVVECGRRNVQLVRASRTRPTKLPPSARCDLVTGYTLINWRIHELVRDNPTTPFVGVNLNDLGRGAVLSTGNDDLQFGIECAKRLMAPDCRNEINLGELDLLQPTPIFGLNQKACDAHGLSPRIAARHRCQVIIE